MSDSPSSHSATLTSEQLEHVRRRSPHLVAVDTHEGLQTAARLLEEQEVVTYGLADARENAWLEAMQNPEDPALFDRALELSVQQAEKSIALEQARIQYYQQTQTVAREAVLRAATAPQLVLVKG